MKPIRELVDLFRDEAETYGRDGAMVRGDKLCERHADLLETALRTWELEELTLDQAAEEAGVSYSTMQKRVASGEIPNAGEKGRPRVRRRDLHGSEAEEGGEMDHADEVLLRRRAG